MTNDSDIHRLLVEIAGDVGETKGTVNACLNEVRSLGMRVSTMEIAHNERFERQNLAIGSLKGLGERAEGARGERTVIGHVVTAFFAVGASMAAMFTAIWTGVFHTPH